VTNTKLLSSVSRYFPSEDYFETRRPELGAENIVEVTRHYSGELPLWQTMVEYLFNLAIAVATVWSAGMIDRGFAVVWGLAVMLFCLIAPLSRNFRFRIFQRPKRRTETWQESASVPRELIDRYVKARDEFFAVCEEVNNAK
jgi:hypothetical protein